MNESSRVRSSQSSSWSSRLFRLTVWLWPYLLTPAWDKSVSLNDVVVKMNFRSGSAPQPQVNAISSRRDVHCEVATLRISHSCVGSAVQMLASTSWPSDHGCLSLARRRAFTFYQTVKICSGAPKAWQTLRRCS